MTSVLNLFIALVVTVKMFLPSAPSANLDRQQTEVIYKFAKIQSPIRAIAWWRVGTGKTRLAYGLFLRSFPYETGRPQICLVINRPGAQYDWANELSIIGVDAYVSNDFSVSYTKPTIWMVSYASLAKLQNTIVQHLYFRNLKFVIVDELYLFGNPKSKRSIALRKLTSRRPCIGLSGTILTTTDNFTFWGQCVAIGISKYLARNATEFRSLYQESNLVKMGSRKKFRSYSPALNWKHKALSRLKENVSVYMPKLLQRTVNKILRVPITNEQRSLIKDIEKNYFVEYENGQRDFLYALEIVHVIRGILNGWIVVDGALHSVPSNKLDGLLASVEELVACEERVVVWCAFRNDILTIGKKLQVASLQMVGGKPFDLVSWQRGKANVVLATMATGSSVNHFADVAYAKFFSLSNKRLELQQSKGRHTRRNSRTESVYYEYYQVKDSYDERLHEHLGKANANEKDLIGTWIKMLLASHSDRA